jgi:methionyl-tRNA synthetase
MAEHRKRTNKYVRSGGQAKRQKRPSPVEFAMQRHLITSAIPYVNGIKHLGNIIGSMLPADVFARYCRATGAETLFICGTDDHGTPAEIAAQKEGVAPRDFVARWYQVQKEIYAGYALSFDYFGQSSSTANHALTQHFARALHKAGLLEVRTQRMLYSAADGRFLPDRYVEGTCPKCGFNKARGDQCDGCGSVLSPIDLINPYSSISGSKELELRDSPHIFFKQSQLVPQLRAWIDAQTWPNLSKSIAYKWLDEGLEDRGITRDIAWGVPVPADLAEALGAPELAKKVFYVWFDAPIGYIAMTQEWATHAHGETQPTQGVPLSPQAARWWYGEAAGDVTYTEFMGKDNVYFHTLSFPGTLIGSAEPWKKVTSLKSFNWLTYYGGKFSTSMGVGIFSGDALELLADIPNGADYWRYYLLSRAPESDDSEFRWADFQSTVNKDLADVLGNFINRTTTLAQKYFGDELPPSGTLTDADATLIDKVNAGLARLTAAHAGSELRRATEETRALWVLGNEYLAQQEPWQVIKTDKARAATILHVALQLMPFYAAIAAPLIPLSCARITARFGLQPTDKTPLAWPATFAVQANLAYRPTTPLGILFPKIADEQIAAWEARFGNQKM